MIIRKGRMKMIIEGSSPFTSASSRLEWIIFNQDGGPPEAY